MKKSLIASLVATSLALTACGGDKHDKVYAEDMVKVAEEQAKQNAPEAEKITFGDEGGPKAGETVATTATADTTTATADSTATASTTASTENTATATADAPTSTADAPTAENQTENTQTATDETKSTETKAEETNSDATKTEEKKDGQ